MRAPNANNHNYTGESVRSRVQSDTKLAKDLHSSLAGYCAQLSEISVRVTQIGYRVCSGGQDCLVVANQIPLIQTNPHGKDELTSSSA